MKNLFLILCFLFPLTIFAQKNEIQISYQPLNQYEYNNGLAIAFFYSIASKTALGVRATYNGLGQTKDEFSGQRHHASLDIVTRQDFIQSRFFQLQGEVGISAMRRYKGENLFWYCGNSSIQEIERMIHANTASKDNFFGFTTGLTTQFNITKSIGIGATYQIKMLVASSDLVYDRKKSFGLCHLNLTYKF